ncbi:uncharacterized protein F5Z01DRAFT_181807 [Emericellopsis atlantica]|uniref:Serine-rich protein n=1 Tax=Emericellopsis atlantica TaxID=2614577 RepID=A0A9P7ZIJ7_9HYPO|nr:uncharacterized protein F5Z01DRAFT_181807 [Emericellopsis atlantica]KAG9252754.1 hypothetical protein F5Z01DRAFT_181807 [Emericellopsis atlantica]
MSVPQTADLSAQWASQQGNEQLQIRMIPYSPPRISSHGSVQTSSRETSRSYAGEENALPISPMQTQSGPKNASSLAPGPTQDIDQESWSRCGVSGPTRSPSNLTFDPDNLSMSSRTSSPRPSSTSSRRRKRVISVNSDTKTFSLLPQSQSPSSSGAGFSSPQFSCTTPESSWGRVSSNIFRVKDRSSSPLTLQTPWTPRMRSGVRKLEQLPDDGEGQLAQTPDALDYSPPLPDCSSSEYGATGAQLSNKNSFQTTASNSTLSERTNFKIYGESSPVRPVARALTGEYERSLAPTSSHSHNYNILGESSSENYSLSDIVRPNTGESNVNYVVLGPPSSSGSRPATNRGPRSEYSRESLVVAPLRPVKTRSSDRASALASRSRESLRRGSLTFLGAAMTQEATLALFAGTSPMHSLADPTSQFSSNRRESVSSAGTLPRTYQWSAALSTVMSESEGDSLPPSRSLSMWSFPNRRSSTNSRDLLSMGSSFGGLDEQAAAAASYACSPWSPPAHGEHPMNKEHTANNRLIRNLDEDGDGLADLHTLHHRSSRTRLAGGFAHNPADRGLRSSGSTRSLNPFSLPSWVRLYYGGGDQRFLVAQASSDSIRSLYNGSLYNDPPYTGFLRNSPRTERLAPVLGTPRRWQHERMSEANSETHPSTPNIASANSCSRQPSSAPSRAPSSRMKTIARMVKKQTSSVWSPHLDRDRRASHLSMWTPPPVARSGENGAVFKRNRQQIFFVVGFAIPFAWMIAACLPLPSKAPGEMTEHSNTNDLNVAGEPAQKSYLAQETLYHNSRWWRTLNRGMSVVGILLIAAAIALIVLGTQQQLA